MITRDTKLFLLISTILILIFSANLSIIHSPLVGILDSIAYFWINATVLGNAFFAKDRRFIKQMFGTLLLITLFGFVSWMVLISYNLDAVRSVVVLGVVTTVTLFVRLRTENIQHGFKPQIEGGWRPSPSLTLVRLFYLGLAALSFYLLFASRASEVYTVWQVLHPMFFVTFFVVSALLVAIIFSSEKVQFKILFVIIFSILSLSLFIIIFPAGDIGVQQTVLGETRLVFDNLALHGYGWPRESILAQVYVWLRGDNFQAALSVIFARILSIDVYWVHLLLVPVLWGTFVPVIMFTITKSLGQKDNTSVLSSVLLSLSPLAIYWGTFSVPNSLGIIFFLFSLTFFLKYLYSDGSKASFLMMAALSFVSFLAHFLAGIISFSLLLLAVALKNYEKEKGIRPTMAKLSLLSAFVFSVSLLPLTLVYQKLFYPFYTYFSIEKISGLSIQEISLLFMFGEYINFSPGYMLAMLVGPLLGFVGMLYSLYRSRKQKLEKNFHVCTLFFFLGFLMFLTQYRILKLFMVGIPFQEERLWIFRDFFAIPFVAIVVAGGIRLFNKKTSGALHRVDFKLSTHTFTHLNRKSFFAYAAVFALLSGWIVTSLYYAYPHYGPLQTTSYELEAVKYIDQTTPEKYVVVADQWIIFAGQMFVGINNPRAFYFSSTDPRGIGLFVQMKINPTNETLIKAMKYNSATIAYFIIEKPRLGARTYDNIIPQAQQNSVQTYPGGTFYYKGEEKLRIFYYKNNTSA